MVPQFLILHLYPDWPKAECEVLQKEVRHVGAADQIVKVYVEVFVEVYAHGGEIPVDDEGFTTLGSSLGSATGSGMIIGCT